MAKWANLTDRQIRFKVGVSGVPWPRCDSGPGEIVEAPDTPGYNRCCLAAGYTRVTPELQKSLEEDAQLRAMIAEEEAEKAKAVINIEKVEIANSDPDHIVQSVIQSVPTPPVEPTQQTEQAPKGNKRRGRANRSPEG